MSSARSSLSSNRSSSPNSCNTSVINENEVRAVLCCVYLIHDSWIGFCCGFKGLHVLQVVYDVSFLFSNLFNR